VKKRASQILIVFGLLFGCSEHGVKPESTTTEASVYLDSILSFMESTSINRKTIDWTAFKKAVREKAVNARTIANTMQAIELALKMLNDNHSYYRLANGRSILYFDAPCPDSESPPDEVPPAGIGYVKVPAFDGFTNGHAQEIEFAQGLQDKIKAQDTANLKGWIIDLRGNGGGNMDPMLVGIGPILGEGVAGYFIDADERAYEFGYKNGARLYSSPLVLSPYTLREPNPKVAVLIGLTGSSGEAIATAFVGRPNTRLFGTHGTCGSSTGIRGTVLSDGAILGVAATYMADRNKNKFHGSIMPDETVSGGTEYVIKAAIDWLSK